MCYASQRDDLLQLSIGLEGNAEILVVLVYGQP